MVAGCTCKLMSEPEPLDLDLGRTAILVVDMQNAFVSKGGIFDLRGFDLGPVQRLIDPIREICNAGRKKGIRVIHVAHVLSPDLREVGPGSSFWYKSVRLYRENPQWREKFIIRGTWGVEIVDPLKPLEGDLVVEKPRFSAFYGTNLDGILKSYDTKFLVSLGCTTNICVEASIRDAANLGYFPILVTDATASNGPPFMQDAAIFNVKLCFGWVASKENLLNALNESQERGRTRHAIHVER